MSDSPTQASPAAAALAAKNISEMKQWLRRALVTGPGYGFTGSDDDAPSTLLAALTDVLAAEVRTIFRAALGQLIDDFAIDPRLWIPEEAMELLHLAQLLGTPARRHHDSWELGITESLQPLVEHRWETVLQLKGAIRSSILHLLHDAPVSMPSRFWLILARRIKPGTEDTLQWLIPSWRGLMRDDWLAACSLVLPQLDGTVREQQAVQAYLPYIIQRVTTGLNAEVRLKQLAEVLPSVNRALSEKLKSGLAQRGVLLPAVSGATLLVDQGGYEKFIGLESYSPDFRQGAKVFRVENRAAYELLILLSSWELRANGDCRVDLRPQLAQNDYFLRRLESEAASAIAFHLDYVQDRTWEDRLNNKLIPSGLILLW